MDPRIQVGRTGGAPIPAATVPSACGPGRWGGVHISPRAIREVLNTRFHPHPGHGEAAVPAWTRPDSIAGIPPAGPGVRQACQALRADVQQREKGAGAPRRYRGPAAGFAQPPGSGSRADRVGAGSPGGGRRPCSWAATQAWGREPSPGGGARPEPAPSSFDSLLAN